MSLVITPNDGVLLFVAYQQGQKKKCPELQTQDSDSAFYYLLNITDS
jgi:hypothetical protein